MPSKKEAKAVEPKKIAWWAGAVVAVFILGILATFGSLYFLSATPTGEALRARLGLDNLKVFNIQTSKTERIVVEESSAIIDASKEVSKTVVSITGKGEPTVDVFGFRNPETRGTGFIVTTDGLIVTNKHVVSGSTEFTVTTQEGKSYEGEVVATDPVTDLALIKIDERGLPVAELGDSDRLQVGQWVIAIGNALGELQNTVTVGVVSALERVATPSDGQGSIETLDGLVQTDAAINQGNSGGPLLNLSGQVIGINTAIAGNAQNIGFAIPANDLRKALDSYRNNGEIIRPYIGVRYQTITKALASSLELQSEAGALLISSSSAPAVVSESPAEKAGLKQNDIITQVNNQVLSETNTLGRVIRQFSPGDAVELKVLRDSQTLTIELTLGELSN